MFSVILSVKYHQFYQLHGQKMRSTTEIKNYYTSLCGYAQTLNDPAKNSTIIYGSDPIHLIPFWKDIFVSYAPLIRVIYSALVVITLRWPAN